MFLSVFIRDCTLVSTKYSTDSFFLVIVHIYLTFLLFFFSLYLLGPLERRTVCKFFFVHLPEESQKKFHTVFLRRFSNNGDLQDLE